MLEDKYGFLWLQTYDNHAYRFDPRTETFERAPGDDEEGGTANITNIKVLPGGSVWRTGQVMNGYCLITD